MLLILIAGCSPGPSLRSTLSDAEPLLRSGRAESALQRLQEARVDHPHSDALLFEIAYAQSAATEGLEDTGEAEAMFRNAHETFLRLTEEPRGEFDASAAFNAATVLIRLDATMENTDRYGERVENMKLAVEALSALVDGEPSFEEAIQNLDHARYTLALLLQNPPRDDESDEEEGEDEPPASGSSVDAV
ncbi:MAG: hypothetical protein L3K26_09050, partial [Candidatus Hydrogenedentes bacterium]|nr:hypothetical protein [Candidatus Hydrogenedentota bacterium]